MHGHRDVVDAETHERRRVVAAFLRGADAQSDGRGATPEEEPPRIVRRLVGGCAVAALLVSGSLVLDLVRPDEPTDWRGRGLVVAADTGARYVVLEDGAAPRPVANLASARLLLGGVVPPTVAPGDDLREHGDGPPVGIGGAPEVLPPAAAIDQPGWAACPDDGDATPTGSLADGRRPSDQALVVQAPSGQLHLVATAPDGSVRRYAFEDLDLVHRTTLQGAAALPVGAGWLALVPEGPPLRAESLALRAAGRPLRYGDAIETRIEATIDGTTEARVGEVVELAGRHYLLGRDSPLLLTEFAATVHALTIGRRARPIAGMSVTARPMRRLAAWPERFPAASDHGSLCVVLDPARAPPGPVLTSAPSVGPAPPTATLVRTGDQVWLVDAAATRHRFGGQADRSALGYDGVEPVPVPGPWLALFDCGVELSREAALAGEERPACTEAEGRTGSK